MGSQHEKVCLLIARAFTAESKVVDLALDNVNSNSLYSKFAVFSDSFCFEITKLHSFKKLEKLEPDRKYHELLKTRELLFYLPKPYWYKR